MNRQLPAVQLQQYGRSVLVGRVDGKPPGRTRKTKELFCDMVPADVVHRQARPHHEGIGKGVGEIFAPGRKGQQLAASFLRHINELNSSAFKEWLEASDEAIFSTRWCKSS